MPFYGRHRKLGVGFRTAGYGRHRSQWVNIIMVNKFKLAVVHFACPNSMHTCACAWINRCTKNGGKSGLGHRAIMGRGLWAAGPLRGVGCGPLGSGPVFSKTHYCIPHTHFASTPHNLLVQYNFQQITARFSAGRC